MRGRTGLVVVLAISAIGSSGAQAQRVASQAVGVPPLLQLDRDAAGGLGVGGSRLFASIGGLAVGIFAGGIAGYRILPHCNGCEDPGLEQMVYGALIGGAIGSALGAAAPDLGSVCSFGKRLKKSLLGAGAAAIAGFLVSGGFDANESVLIVVPAASVGGALGSLGRCWKSRAAQAP